MKNKIYLDYASTTPLDEEVLKEMIPFLKEKFGNPSSVHSFGREAFEAIELSREKTAGFLNCSSEEIIFTGSATEANNLAIFGVIKALRGKFKKPHIVTTQIEHPSVLNPCNELERQGIEVSYIKPLPDGIIDIADIKKNLKKNTVLVSIMYANNEIGTIQPIEEIANIIHKFRKANSSLSLFFHTDAVQAANYLDCDTQKLGVDMLTLSGHKVYGPKGIGVLYAKREVILSPLIYGGGQENKLRSGTENVAGIVGLANALSKVKKIRPREAKRVKKLRDALLEKILKEIPGVELNGSLEKRLPNNINISIPALGGEELVAILDEKGVAISTGSACHAKSVEPSHVILALGKSKKEAFSSLRITLGRYTTREEIEYTFSVLKEVVAREH